MGYRDRHTTLNSDAGIFVLLNISVSHAACIRVGGFLFKQSDITMLIMISGFQDHDDLYSQTSPCNQSWEREWEDCFSADYRLERPANTPANQHKNPIFCAILFRAGSETGYSYVSDRGRSPFICSNISGIFSGLNTSLRVPLFLFHKGWQCVMSAIPTRRRYIVYSVDTLRISRNARRYQPYPLFLFVLFTRFLSHNELEINSNLRREILAMSITRQPGIHLHNVTHAWRGWNNTNLSSKDQSATIEFNISMQG